MDSVLQESRVNTWSGQQLTSRRREPDSLDGRVFWFWLIPAAVLAFGLYAAGAAWPAVVLGLTAFAIAALIAPEMGFYGYFAWQALDPVFLMQESAIFTPSKALAPFLILISLLRIGVPRSPMLVSKPCVTAMLLFGLYGCVTIPMAVEPLLALRYAMQIIVQVLLIVVTIHTLRTRAMIGRALFVAVLGGMTASVVMLWTGGGSGQFRRATLGEYTNPNTTANAISVALMCVPAAWGYAKGFALRIVCVLAVPLMLTAVMTTGSRGALGAVIFAFVMSAILVRRAGFIWRFAVPAVCASLALVTVFFVLGADFLPPESQKRLSQIFDPGAGLERESRWYIWELTLRTYLKHPWGFGFGNTQNILAQEHGFQRDAHSSYLSALVDVGPIGFALFAYGLWQLVKCVVRIRQANPGIPSAMMLGYLVLSSLTQTTHFTKWFWIPVTVCLLLAEQTEREKRLTLVVSQK